MCRYLSLFLTLIASILTVSGQGPTSDEEQIAEARRRVNGPPLTTALASKVVKVPLVGTKVLPLVEIRINGRGPYRLLVDTAANVTLLQMRVADELRLKVLRPGESSRLVAVDTLEIGGATFGGLVVGARAWNEDIDGVLGFGIFTDCLMTLDYASQRLEISKGALPEPDGKTVFKYGLDNRSPTLDMTVAGSKMTMLFDTGATQAIVMSEKEASKFSFKEGLKAGPQVWTFDNGRSQARIGRLSGNAVVGGHTIREPVIHVWSDDPPLIGSAFLSDLKVTFDQKNQRVKIVR